MINIATNLEDLERQLAEVLNTSNFEINRIDFDKQDDWKINNGMMSHKSGGYFHVIGVENSEDQEQNIYLFQPQSAITGLLLHIEKGIIYVLLQARIEPGNTGILQLGPTIQSTPANFLRMHGGKGTPYLDFFYSAHKNVIGFTSSNHLDIGKLFYQKSKLLNYALVDQFMETEDSFIWTPLNVLLEAMRKDYLINTDLRSLIGVYDWDSLLGFQTKSDFSPSNMLNYYLKQRLEVNCTSRFVPIDESENICTTKRAIYTKGEKDSEIALYSIKTKYREINEWIQPLWQAKGKGKVLLLCRNWDSETDIEFLLTVKYERGVAGFYTISPSLLAYPNEEYNEDLFNIGEIRNEFYQSDEGGRFINHEYLFRVSEVKDQIQIGENQFWVGVRELKNILSMHNMPSIQLRNICSVIIEKLNPNTLSNSKFS